MPTPLAETATLSQALGDLAHGLFPNKDGTETAHLDAMPFNGKLYVRGWDDEPWERRRGDRDGGLGSLALPMGARDTETPF
jgi:hypothetical protein